MMCLETFINYEVLYVPREMLAIALKACRDSNGLPEGRAPWDPLTYSAPMTACHFLSLPKWLTCILSHGDVLMEPAPEMERNKTPICLPIKSSLLLKLDPIENLLN